MPGSSQSRRGADLSPAGAHRRARLLALSVAAVTVFAGLGGQASAGGDAETTAMRPAPPSTDQVRVPLDQVLGARTARRARGSGGLDVPPAGKSGGALFPDRRLVAVYGAPQLGATIVGKKSPRGSANEAARLAARYGEVDPRPAIPGIDLIATIATSDQGPSGLYRTRQSQALIDTYLAAARKVGARLILDVQPGRARFLREVRALRPWLVQPDVDVALDPEWNVGRRGVPGVTEGKVTAKELNKVSRWLARLVSRNELPQKALFVHQFREGSVRKRARIAQRGTRAAVTLSFDGIGSPRAKEAGYRNLGQPGLFNGFSVFVSLDSDVMGFRRVAGLEPPPDYVMYQ